MKNKRYAPFFLGIAALLASSTIFGMDWRKQFEMEENASLMREIEEITATQERLEKLEENKLRQLDLMLKYLQANRFIHLRAANKIDLLTTDIIKLFDKADDLGINANADTYCNPTHRKNMYNFLEKIQVGINRYFDLISEVSVLQKNDRVVFLVPKNNMDSVCPKKLANTTELLIKKLNINQLLVKHPNRHTSQLEKEFSSINIPFSPSNDSNQKFQPVLFIKNKQFYPCYLGNDLLGTKRILILENWRRSKYIRKRLQDHGFNVLEVSFPKQHLRKIIELK